MHELQEKISMEMTSFFYNKDDWVGVFHGSTLNKGKKSIMLTGESDQVRALHLDSFIKWIFISCR